MRYYGTLLNFYSRWIREVQGYIDDPSSSGYEEREQKILIPVWKEEIERYTKEQDELREEARRRMRNRPFWKKLLRKV